MGALFGHRAARIPTDFDPRQQPPASLREGVVVGKFRMKSANHPRARSISHRGLGRRRIYTVLMRRDTASYRSLMAIRRNFAASTSERSVHARHCNDRSRYRRNSAHGRLRGSVRADI